MAVSQRPLTKIESLMATLSKKLLNSNGHSFKITAQGWQCRYCFLVANPGCLKKRSRKRCVPKLVGDDLGLSSVGSNYCIEAAPVPKSIPVDPEAEARVSCVLE